MSSSRCIVPRLSEKRCDSERHGLELAEGSSSRDFVVNVIALEAAQHTVTPARAPTGWDVFALLARRTIGRVRSFLSRSITAQLIHTIVGAIILLFIVSVAPQPSQRYPRC